MIQLKASLNRATICFLLASIAAATSSAAEPGPAGKATKGSKVSVQEFGKVEVQKYPWGWIRWLMNDQIDPDAEMTFGVVYVKPHQENPAHVHPNSAEYLHVLEGACEHLVGTKWVTLKAGDTLRIPKGVPHRARTKEKACRVVVVYDTGRRQFVPVKQDKGK